MKYISLIAGYSFLGGAACVVRETPLNVVELLCIQLFFNVMPMSHKAFIVWWFEADGGKRAEKHSRRNILV